MLKQAKFCATPPLFGWFSVTEGSVFRENLLIFNAEGSAVHEISPVLSMYELKEIENQIIFFSDDKAEGVMWSCEYLDLGSEVEY